jgi:hypothetical protein
VKDVMSRDSDRYEEVTRSILQQCRSGLGIGEVEPKGKVPGTSGTEREIDVMYEG